MYGLPSYRFKAAPPPPEPELAGAFAACGVELEDKKEFGLAANAYGRAARHSSPGEHDAAVERTRSAATEDDEEGGGGRLLPELDAAGVTKNTLGSMEMLRLEPTQMTAVGGTRVAGHWSQESELAGMSLFEPRSEPHRRRTQSTARSADHRATTAEWELYGPCALVLRLTRWRPLPQVGVRALQHRGSRSGRRVCLWRAVGERPAAPDR